MASSHLVLKAARGDCTLCRTSPMTERHVEPMIVCEGMDINWGEDMNICKDCAGVIADLIGRVDEEKYEKLHDKYRKLVQQHESLQEQFVEVSELNERMRGGAAARKESRERSVA